MKIKIRGYSSEQAAFYTSPLGEYDTPLLVFAESFAAMSEFLAACNKDLESCRANGATDEQECCVKVEGNEREIEARRQQAITAREDWILAEAARIRKRRDTAGFGDYPLGEIVP